MSIICSWQYMAGINGNTAALKKSGIPIKKLGLIQNGIIILSILIITLLSGWLLAQHTNAAWPYVDSFTTWGQRGDNDNGRQEIPGELAVLVGY